MNTGSPDAAPDAVAVSRPRMDVDIVCVGFGPAMGGFLATLSKRLLRPDGSPAFPSTVMPGAPLQVVCYERADDLAFGVSGLVTRARALRTTFPQLDTAGIPLAAPVRVEKLVYLLDPIGASRRSASMRLAEGLLRSFGWALGLKHQAWELPWTPAFLHKPGGLVLSLGQFMQWVGQHILSTGTVQIWPGCPVAEALIEGDKVVGVRLVDQGVDRAGRPAPGFSPGMEIRAALTVVGDGPVGPVSRQLDAHLGLPAGHHQRDWAVGMKCVVDLPQDTPLEPGTVVHTLGYPEPEIFGFLYVHPDRVASLGIFVPSWFDSPVRTAYRYLQHWMLHPYLWRWLQGAALRSWGAKTIAEWGRRGEPYLVGHGYARIGEGSGATNLLTNSGVDEAWATGVQLAEAVLELLQAGKPFTRENLQDTYIRRRRASWVEAEARVAERARDGFQHGLIPGLLGVLLSRLTKGRVSLFGGPLPPHRRIRTYEDYFRGRLAAEELRRLRSEAAVKGLPLHGLLMDRCGWPAIPYEGRLLISQQDALLRGGKVHAPPGYADHVLFLYPQVCESCGTKVCIELCSGQAIQPNPAGGVPLFEREKCVHCGACVWNCAQPAPDDPERGAIAFRAGPGGLHSAEN